MTLPDPGEPEPPLPPQPVTGVVAAEPHNDTPPYGIPVAPLAQPWPAAPEPSGDASETVQLPTVPAAGPAPATAEFPAAGADAPTAAFPGTGAAAATTPFPAAAFPAAETAAFPAFPDAAAGAGAGRGGGGGREERSGSSAPRRLLPLLLGAAAVVALGGTALAVWVLPEPAGSDTALLDAKASAPAAVAPATSSSAPVSASASASPSASRSASPSPSKSPSPSASRSAASSAPPSPSASASRSPSPSKPPAASGPTLRYGDSGAEVEKLQRLLAGKGLFPYKINGKFDWRVENAVSTFQYNNDIDEEWGVYGPITRRALEG
ncbi:peptidoglycan-binding protein [Streptomyces sp. NPDC059874]|uniref:peptidoglycan-binding domain-containing protein n=1 Tax=Streptomyces sp. NPDC059874 TaxID=3346983 RepID=UPI003653D2A8